MVTRSRVRTTRPNPRYAGHVSTISPLPRSYKEAFNDPNWRNAMFDEYNALIKNKTWTSVPRPEGANIVRCMCEHQNYLTCLFSLLERLKADNKIRVNQLVTILSIKSSIHNLDRINIQCHKFNPYRISQVTDRRACLMLSLKVFPLSLWILKHLCAWFQRFAAYITTVGFTPSRCDSSLFIYRQGDDTAFLLLYVDDIVLTASSDRLLQQIIASLHRDVSIAIEISERAHMVGSVCLYMHDPREPHFSALKRILRYVQGTLDYGLQLFSSTNDSLIAYSDADWAGCPTTRRSTSGYLFLLTTSTLWSSKRQPTLSRSSAEAEYRGVANAVAETCWIRNLLRELHTPLSSATIVYCDNVSVVYLSSNPVQHQRTKHIEIDIHFVRDLVATGQVRVLHVPSRFQYADIFTKGLPSALFDEFRDSLSVRCTPALTAGEC
ncbi:ribonuclease H-like domain-containing protein [Tanacetum coccineum]